MPTDRKEKVIESHIQEELLADAEEAREAKLHAAAQTRRAAIEKRNADARAAMKSTAAAESYAVKRDENVIDFSKQEETTAMADKQKTELEDGQPGTNEGADMPNSHDKKIDPVEESARSTASSS